MAQRIILNQNVLAGKPLIKGTRISVQLILDSLSSGMTVKELMKEYGLSKEDVLAAIDYAAKSLQKQEVYHAPVFS